MTIHIDCTGAGAVTLKAPTSGDYTLLLPPNAGLVGQVLTTDGNGLLSWTTPSAGSGGGTTTVPVATTGQRGIVQIGSGINVADGVISVPPGSYNLPIASVNGLGGVRGGGTGITIDATGRLSLSATLASSASTYDDINIYRRDYVGDPTFSEETFFKSTVQMPSAVAEMQPMTVAKETQFYVINFAKYWHMNSSEDCGPKLNEVMCAASDLAMQMRGTGAYDAAANVRVRVFLPVNDYFLRTQAVIPSNVELDCMGMFWRYDAGGLSNTYIPAIACTPLGHVGNLTIRGHVTAPDADRGSCFICGKVFQSGTSTASFELVDNGYGYVDEQVVTLEVHGQGKTTDNPFQQAQIRIKSVRTAVINGVTRTGVIDTWEVARSGAYDRPLANVKKQGHYPKVTADGRQPGETATWRVKAYTAEFSGGKYKAYEEGNSPFGQTLIHHLNALEAGDNLTAAGLMADNSDPTHGYKMGIQISGKNVEINRLYALRGRVGIWFRDGSDARVNNINTVLSGTALQIGGYTSFTCHNAALDSNQWMGLRMYGSCGIQMAIRIFWENANDARTNLTSTGASVPVRPHASGYAVKIGDAGSDGQLISSLDLRIQLTNAGGKFTETNGVKTYNGTGLYIDRLANSRLNIVYGNTEYNGRPNTQTKSITRLIEWGTTTASAEFDLAPNDRLLKSTNSIHGVVDRISGSLFIGDPLGNDLYIYDSQAGGVCRQRGVYEFSGTTAPTGSTGVGKAKQGSRYTKTSGAAPFLYVQTNADANFPTWAPL